MKTLILDNHDSFTWNLAQILGTLNGEEPWVVSNDALTMDALLALPFDNILISPGPGHPGVPRDLGISAEVLHQALGLEPAARRAPLTGVPVLGVCLGMQAIAHACGQAVVRAPEPRHGRLSPISHDGAGLFRGLPNPLNVVRYHSLHVPGPLRAPLRPTAHTAEGVLMALVHVNLPVWGVQFHPESICTEQGHALLTNWRNLSHKTLRERTPRIVVPRAMAAAAEEGVQAEPGSVPEFVPGPEPLHPACGALKARLRWHTRPAPCDAERAFLALFADAPVAFWLDSARVIPGMARFSFLGAIDHPGSAWYRYDTTTRTLVATPAQSPDREPSAAPVEQVVDNHFDWLNATLRTRFTSDPEPPFPFTGGLIGYLGYELKRDSLPALPPPRHRSPSPDAVWMDPRRWLVFDHELNLLHCVVLDESEPGESDPREAGGGSDPLADWVQQVGDALTGASAPKGASDPQGASAPDAPAFHHPPVPFVLEQSEHTYRGAIAACLEEIRAGETYEVCLTNRLRSATRPADALSLYRALRRHNPAPYAAFLRLPGTDILCSSPERFLRIDRQRTIEAKPIKGTVRRDHHPIGDMMLAEQLRTAEKDRSENLMITDLLRNDLGRVSVTGSVNVPALMQIESYATVHQLVSTVRGTLRPDCSTVEAIRAAFPGGSMTGAPKERTLEIIDRLEESARGIYSGAIGYLSLDGAADLNIVIRTLVADARGLELGVGGAIVALSDPVAEYREILLKGEVLVRAVDATR